jgi:ADP-heptose:LPS heptosyltransferase
MPATTYSQPAVLQVNNLGDQLLALPAVRALASLFPGGLQLLLGEGMLSFFYRGLPVGETVRVWWETGRDDRFDVERTARAAGPCDLFLCLSRHALPSVAVLARRMGATCTIGHDSIFDHHVRADDGMHMFDRLFAIPQCLDPSLRFDDYSQAPVFSGAAEDAAARCAATIRQPRGRLLFVHPETRPEKTWPADRLAWVLERFLAERRDYTAVVSSVEPVDVGRFRGRAAWLDLHLELALAVVRHADLFLGVDSCCLHAADLGRVPGVALFGPTSPSQWGFRLSPGSRHAAGASMSDIPPETVLEALLDLAERPRPRGGEVWS